VHPPTITPALFRNRITFDTAVDLPTPGGPVTNHMPKSALSLHGR